MTKCKNCNCNCHCSLKEHGDMYGLCSCNVHTEEKERSGECCQLDDQEKAEQDTYEHSVLKTKEQK